MSRRMTSDDLVRAVRSRGMIPSDTSTYTDEAIINILNEEIDVGLLDSIMSVSEEYLVYSEDIAVIPGQKAYKIPYRAVGNKLRDVFIVDSSTSLYECTRISIEEIAQYSGNTSSFSGRLFGFYVQNDSIIFPNASIDSYTTIRMYFYLRPNKLVLEEQCCQITAIDTLTGIISVSTIDSEFSSLPNVDFICNKSPNKIISYDVPIMSISASTNPKTITLDPSNIPAGLAVGDWISQQEETPIPNVPTEWHPVLAQRAVVYIMEAIGDTEGLTNSLKKLAQMEKSVMKMTDNRVEGAPQKIKNRNGLLSGRNSFRSRGF